MNLDSTQPQKATETFQEFMNEVVLDDEALSYEIENYEENLDDAEDEMTSTANSAEEQTSWEEDYDETLAVLNLLYEIAEEVDADGEVITNEYI